MNRLLHALTLSAVAAITAGPFAQADGQNPQGAGPDAHAEPRVVNCIS
jgi:hypothetical protein